MVDALIVTGTRKGIGREIALHGLAQGYRVFGCSRGESTIVHEAYTHFSLDVADERAVVDMVRTVSRQDLRVHALVNNAGLASMNHLVTTPLGTAERLFGTNVFGTFLFMREVSKLMIRQRHGRIVNFSTVAVPFNLEGEAVYAASKAAVESLTRVAAREFAGYGITVNALGPTPVETDLIKGVPTAKIQELLQRQAIKRFGTVADVLNVIDFFLDDDSGFVTGQVIYLGGVG